MNCTLEEKALLDCIHRNPQIKQQEIAKQIGKSISTVKRLTVGLVEKGIIERKNGKRNGFWEIK
ncbi:MarR family transcriptional regulator [Odoribacter sp. OttesenSCG-928-J03]|nr:MarR family transcriptional regulator [Odoribacter sp. OttesenSCG-928-J03]MDL2282940.1 MarR family transcriptional regulator [Odoribacter sp. OttesenSCG-928-G04]